MVQGGGDRAADGARFRMKGMHSIENREITAFFDIFDFSFIDGRAVGLSKPHHSKRIPFIEQSCNVRGDLNQQMQTT